MQAPEVHSGVCYTIGTAYKPKLPNVTSSDERNIADHIISCLLLINKIVRLYMMITIMSMGSYCVFELRPTGLLFILQVLYEHGEPWWNDIDRGNICPRELSGNPAGSHLEA
jgi:hypothetical protein